MLLTIPELLTAAQVDEARRALDAAEWVDGRVTAGPQSARAKDNEQLPEQPAVARFSTALQPLSRRTLVRHPRRQRHPPDRRHRASHAHRSVGDALSLAA